MKKFKVSDITILALFIALGVVLKMCSVPIFDYIAKIEFFKVFVIMAACLYGPVSAGMVAGGVDVLAYILMPQAYPILPWITLAYVLGGIIAGLVFRYSGRCGELIRIILTVYVPGMITCLIVSYILLNSFFPDASLGWFFMIRLSVEIVIDIIIVYIVRMIYPVVRKWK